MTPEHKHARVPEWFPAWAAELSELYFSGSTSLFVLHGNVHDLVPLTADGSAYGGASDFLAEQVFGRWDLVLYYDLARGLRAFAGRDGARLKEMVVRANEKVGDLALARKDPSTTFAMLDRFVQNNIMAGEDSVSAAILIDHASFLLPSGEPGRLSPAASQQVVTLLNWASSPHVKRLNMAMILMDDSAAALSERVTSNPYVASIEVSMPDAAARAKFLHYALEGRDLHLASDYSEAELTRLTAGISCVDINVMIQSAFESSHRLDATRMRGLKKELIERQCRGLLEFMEPKWNTDVLVGHAAVKQRLREDAQLLQRGDTETLPMGYLVCGPVGTGKTFLAQCMAGEMGAPCLVLKNFRSKYVGETEGNLERVLGVLRAMGPVVVVVDEADAALGNREQEGDSGTSSRVFSLIAAQMGDTRYRGKILWMLLTSRPDLLPIDLKRQGRAEVHIPLFYPTAQNELHAMFQAMGRKAGINLSPDEIPDVPLTGQFSGADIEGIVTRAARRSRLIGEPGIGKAALERELASFLPSLDGLEKEMQEIAAMLECTDAEFLPEAFRKRVQEPGGRERLQHRFFELKGIL
ncbi:MAG TPA: AAA family ATPase [Bryobacteraceae bacterium]|jgi:AAA+ superfamily predicted ATPase|nr:AAA family ATPase [Bryobacteraceae bacterium]